MRVASLRERLLAALVDAAVVILGITVVVGLGIGGAAVCGRLRGGGDEDETDPHDDEDADEEDVSPLGFRDVGDDLDDQNGRSRGIRRGTDEFLQSPLLRAALSGASAGLAVAHRNSRSPGFRVVGLRRVDARTGGPMSVRSGSIGVLFDQTQQALTRPLFRFRADRERARMNELAPKLKEIEHSYATDRQARERALAGFYEANEVNPFAGCAWIVAGPILSKLVLAVAIRNRRTTYDRVTGTIVLRDR